jgi:hypothetical protein
MPLFIIRELPLSGERGRLKRRRSSSRQQLLEEPAELAGTINEMNF